MRAIINFFVVILILTLLSSCSKSKSNGAKSYSNDNKDPSHNYSIYNSKTFPKEIDKFDSLISYKENDYGLVVTDIPKSSIQLIELNTKKKISIYIPFDYKYIIDCAAINNNIYILYMDNNYITYISSVDEDGNIMKQTQCKYCCESIILNDDFIGVWYYDGKDDRNLIQDVILTKYDLNLEYLDSINISSKLALNNNSSISELLVDKSGNAWAEINYNIKENQTEGVLSYKTKIVQFDYNNYSIIYSIDDINAQNGIDSIYVNDALMVVYSEGNKTFINKYDKNNGKTLDYFEINRADSVFDYYPEYIFAYKRDNQIYALNYNKQEIEIDELNGDIVNSHITTDYSVIVTLQFVPNIEVYRVDDNGEIIDTISFSIEDNKFISNLFSVSDKYFIFSIKDNIDNINQFLIFDRRTQEKYLYNVETIGEITDLEIINDKDVYITVSQDTEMYIYKCDILNNLINEIKFKNSSEYDNIILSSTSDNNILYILNKEKKYYIFESEPDNNIAVFECEYYYWEISFIRGFGYKKFFVYTPSELYEYTDSIRKIKNIYELSYECSVDYAHPNSIDDIVVYGRDYRTNEYNVYIIKANTEINKKIIEAYVSQDIEKYVFPWITKFNNRNDKIFIKVLDESESNLIVNDCDILIYDNKYDIYSYIVNKSLYNLKYLCNDTECFSFSYGNINNTDYIYKFIPAFYIYEYKENEFNSVSDEEIIENLILYDIEQYIDFEHCTVNFSKSDFRTCAQLLIEKKNLSLCEYKSTDDLFNHNSIRSFNESAVIAPIFNVSIIDNENSQDSISFLKTLYEDDYQNMYINNLYDGLSVKESLYQKVLYKKELYNLKPEIFTDSFENIGREYRYNNKVYSIACDELIEYSLNNQTYDETISILEKKINLYLKELG